MSAECKVDLTLTSLAALREAVAVHVMGWRADEYRRRSEVEWEGTPDMMTFPSGWNVIDPRCWIRIIEVMRKEKWSHCLHADELDILNGDYHANFSRMGKTFSAEATAPGIAICLAALRAKGITVDLELGE